jgi:hypothetical protein
MLRHTLSNFYTPNVPVTLCLRISRFRLCMHNPSGGRVRFNKRALLLLKEATMDSAGTASRGRVGAGEVAVAVGGRGHGASLVTAR